jgi:hypothetical protein
MVWAETENKVLAARIIPLWSNHVNRCVTEILIWRVGYTKTPFEHQQRNLCEKILRELKLLKPSGIFTYHQV